MKNSGFNKVQAGRERKATQQPRGNKQGQDRHRNNAPTAPARPPDRAGHARNSPNAAQDWYIAPRAICRGYPAT